MVQKLLADRFKLAFVTTRKNSPSTLLSLERMDRSSPRTRGLLTALLTCFFEDPGDLPVRNATMADFAGLMQIYLDRPVVDQTGLKGRFDFVLKWTPDESQVGGRGIQSTATG